MKFKLKTVFALVAGTLLAGPVLAETERESLEMLRQTTMNLIDALVDQGVLTRENADALIRKAEKQAARKAAVVDKPGTVRVPYVPEVVKNEIREQLKQEVLAQARNEGWAAPNVIPDWVERLRIEGDLRVRYQSEMFADDNADASRYAQADLVGLSRSGDLGAINSSGVPVGNTTEDRDRWRIRMRLGLLAKPSDWVSVGLRLSTGNTTDRVSTNQSLGQNFNKYQIVLDRAYIKLDPLEWLSVSAGRIPNPWLSTDLIWDEDLNFEGVAATVKRVAQASSVRPFLTAGVFPIREDSPPTRDDRWLHGVQLGAEWEPAVNTRLKVAVARYEYRNLEGQVDPAYDLLGPLAAYGKYEYGAGLRQRGNTVFRTNNALDAGDTIWGLASKFKPLAVTVAADVTYLDPVHVLLSAEYVKNTAFDREEILRRTGFDVDDASDTGYLLRLAVGTLKVKARGDWQASLTYRRLGSDAVLDAFTDSDFGLGGTNSKGYVLGLSYGIANGTSLNARWLSADSIASPTGLTGDSFGVDVFQFDLSTQF